MLFIILHHCFLRTHEIDGVVFAPAFFLNIGYMATAVFFFLSGYGMFLSLERNNPISFSYVTKKIRKLFYPYIYYWILCLCVIYFGVSTIDISKPVFNNLLYSFIRIGMPVDHTNWFFRVIVGVYIYLFIMYAFIKKSSPVIRLCFIILGVISYSLFAYSLGLESTWYKSLVCFPIGCVFAYKYDLIESLVLKYGRIILVISFFVLAISYFLLRSTVGYMINGAAFTLICILLMQYNRFQNLRFLNFVGTYSILFYFMQEIALSYYPICIYNQLLFSIVTILVTTILSVIYVGTENILSKINTNKSY